MNRKIVISTNNKNKLKEIKKILEDLPIEVLSKRDLGLEAFDVVEDGDTLEKNSIKKAKVLKEKTEYMVMADDSGLFVDSLNGDPGVHSARYAGVDGDDLANNKKLLKNMKDIPLEKRNAHFKAVIALITEDDKTITVSGKCYGHIAFEPQGDNKFGYDPLFIPNNYEESFAELDGEVKNEISHRARALEGIKKELKELLKEE
jgi:XTP/dITP diphosphohydrolase